MRLLCAKHAIITDECRKNKGDNTVIREAIERIRDEFLACALSWPLGQGTKFHVKLEIEREIEK